MTIVAAGCTIVAEDMSNIVNLTDCNQLTLQGPLTLRHIAPCGTQGRVTALGTDTNGTAWSDWLVRRYSAGGCAVRVSSSPNCRIIGVTGQNGGHATFFESDGSGGNHFLDCAIGCGPKPPGAVEEQLVSNWADGLHSIGAFPGPYIRNFTFSGVLLDDCIAIRGVFC